MPALIKLVFLAGVAYASHARAKEASSGGCSTGVCADDAEELGDSSFVQLKGKTPEPVSHQVPVAVPLYEAKSGGTHTSAIRVQFGTPGVVCNIEVDIGSTLFWVVSNEAQKSTNVTPHDGISYTPWQSMTSTNLDKYGKFVYATGSAAGPYGRDQVTIRGVVALELEFVAASKVAQTQLWKVCGIIGFAQGSQIQHELFESLKLPHVMSYTLDKNISGATQFHEQIGTMYLGGVSRSQYKGGIACVPAISAGTRINGSSTLNTNNEPFDNENITDALWWQVEAKQISVVGPKGTLAAPANSIKQMFFDSGAPFIPDAQTAKLFKDYFNELPNFPDMMKHYRTNISCSTVNRSSLPSLVVQLAGFELLLTPDMYWQDVGTGCIWYLSYEPPSSLLADLNGIMVIGEIFFSHYVAVFDWDRKQVGVATKIDSSLPNLPQTCTNFLQAE